LIELFQITGNEQNQLQTIIDADVAKDRDRARKKSARKRQDRQTYEANALARQKPWEAFGISRAQWYRLGRPEPESPEPNV
jgi:ElaB/YqjD/DUF883 family membrane-anchored ribosome-binding protein